MGVRTTERFQLQLLGEFCLTDPRGEAIDIRSTKARALLAMLATAERGRRTRFWLQERLWSSSSSNDSLGKELSNLRERFRASGLDVLPKGGPRDVVRLDLDCFSIDARKSSPTPCGVFLAGLDLPHERKFGEWLQGTRAYFESFAPLVEAIPTTSALTKVGALPRFCIGIPPIVWNVKFVGEDRKLVLTDIQDQIAKSLLHHGGTVLYDRRSEVSLQSTLDAIQHPQYHLLFKVTESSSQLVVTIQLVQGDTSQIVCARRHELDPGGVDHLLEDKNMTTQLVAETVDEILFTLHRHEPGRPSEASRVLRLVDEAVTGMFELNFTSLDRARSNLDTAVEELPESAIYAWRAYLSAHQVDDPRIADLKQIQEEARYFARRTIELDRYNPLALSLLTHGYAFTLREFDTASDCLQRAKSLHSDHVMTYDADALLNLYLGKLPQSRASALQAIRLGRFLPFRYVFYTSLCMIDALSGNYESAIVAGEKSLRMQPASSNRPYPPTVRYLAESYARLGEIDKAHELIDRLTKAQNDANVNQRAVPTMQIGKFLHVIQKNFKPPNRPPPSLLSP